MKQGKRRLDFSKTYRRVRFSFKNFMHNLNDSLAASGIAILAALAPSSSAPPGEAKISSTFSQRSSPVKSFFFNQNSGITLYQRHSIVILMVFCHVGRRNQDGSFSLRLQLAKGNSAGTADDQIGSCHTFRHIVDVFPQINVGMFLQIQALFPQPAEAST